MSFTLNDFKSSDTPDIENVELENEDNQALETQPEVESPAEGDVTSEQTEDAASEEDVSSDAQSETAGAESYTPDFTYKVKDETKEFPQWLRDSIKSKDQEDELRDYFTKLDGFDGIKESRAALESEYNSYKEQIQTQVVPTLQKIQSFDQAVKMGDYSTAMELADMKPEKLIDSLLLSDSHSQILYKKVLDHIGLEEQGPQALEQKRQAYQEQINSSKLEQENTSLQSQLEQIRKDNYDQMLSFSISQHQGAADAYDARSGKGAFENLVRDYGHMKWVSGVKLTPQQVVNEVANLIGGVPVQNTNQPTPTQQPMQPTQQPVAPAAKPATIPNLQGGTPSSVVAQQADTWGSWQEKMRMAQDDL